MVGCMPCVLTSHGDRPALASTKERAHEQRHHGACSPLLQTYLSIKESRAIISWVAEGEAWRLEGEDEPR